MRKKSVAKFSLANNIFWEHTKYANHLEFISDCADLNDFSCILKDKNFVKIITISRIKRLLRM